ncbi:MAG TPA: Crp/Fnr family transcriptional regulator [Erysipelotrichaceae bacterium]|nr:Crp/Fnr family transcriptional regulator [Erysipelotrichaceae bacterium]
MKLNDHTIALLMEHGSLMHCPMNHILQQADQQAGNLYIVHSGRLRVFLSNEHGKELTLDVIHKGSVFGTNSFLYHGTHKVSIQSVTEARLIVCSRDTIRTLSASHPELSRDLLQYFIEENNHLTHLLESITLYSAADRVMDFLLVATDQGKRQIPYTHEDIAMCLSMNRVTVSRIIKNLCDQGIVENSYGKISLKNPEELMHRLKKITK